MAKYHDPNVRKVIAILILEEDKQSVGVMVRQVSERTNLSLNAAECALRVLVDGGFVTYKLRLGTGGTMDTYFEIKGNVPVSLG